MAFLLFPVTAPSCEKRKAGKSADFSAFANMKIMIPLILSERDPCAETILNRFLQDHIFNEQRNAAVVAVQKFHLVVRVEQFGGNLHLNAVGGVDAAALHAADARRS